MVSQIISLLEGENANVSWNEKIIDPDNPSQSRQIDVLVKKNNLITLIECRLHKQRQNVKWIEELIGRQSSLRAHSIIGVSSSGFTKGALVKADKFGINLRSIDTLTNEEIIKWGNPIKFSLFYWKPLELTLDFYFENNVFKKLNAQKVKAELLQHPYFQTIITTHLKFNDTSNLKLCDKLGKKFRFHGDFIVPNFFLCNELVRKIHNNCLATLEELPLSIPQVLLYKDPNNPTQETYIQNLNLGETRVIYNGKNVCISLDISQLNLPPLCQFQFVNYSCEEIVNMEYFELIGVENMQVKPGNFQLNVKSIN